jgi:hypothetical protein
LKGEAYTIILSLTVPGDIEECASIPEDEFSGAVIESTD